MIQRFYTNRLSKELNEFMRIGSEVVYYKDHLAEIAEKDKEIKDLQDKLLQVLDMLDKLERKP